MSQALTESIELTPILYVSDFQKSVDYYTNKLGFTKLWDWGTPPTFGCVSRGGITIFFCHKGQGQPGMWISLFVCNADEFYAELKERGADIVREIQDEPWGMREFHVRDPDGHTFRFGHGRQEKDLKVKRVDLNLRLEERLAKVVEDLAKASGQTVGEFLEGTLLHTFEAVPGQEGQAVASPYGKGTFAVIKRLKEKHGLDYDTHANARFTEKS
jgi:catechol 2,3-dioxygenase-like lactoylglutathione lyase family enzyme